MIWLKGCLYMVIAGLSAWLNDQKWLPAVLAALIALRAYIDQSPARANGYQDPGTTRAEVDAKRDPPPCDPDPAEKG